MPVSKGRRKSKTIRRPTPPKSAVAAREKDVKESPQWYAWIMFALMAIGVALVVYRYIFDTDQIVMLGGLGSIAVGFIMTTGYH
jgi:positive regulator of sigma E activity